MTIVIAEFSIGDLVYHSLFGYRGVVVDIDPTFQLSEEWYAAVAKSKPPKDKPWYHVLVHDAEHTAYVAERHLQVDANIDPVMHPMLDDFFSGFKQGKYVSHGHVN